MPAKADGMQSLTESGVLVDSFDNRPKEARDLNALRLGAAIDSDLERLKTELAAGKDAKP